MWFNEVAPGVKPYAFSTRLTGHLTPAESGTYQFSLVSAGLSRLFVDEQLIVDNWDAWQPGDAYFGSGSAEAIGAADLNAGQTYDLVVEYAARSRGELLEGSWNATSVLLDAGDAIERAAELAAGPSKPLDNTDFTHPYRKKLTRVFVARALARLAGLDAGPSSYETGV